MMISNFDIIKYIEERKKRFSMYKEKLNVYSLSSNNSVNDFCESVDELSVLADERSKNKELEELSERLRNDYYNLSEEDIKILENNYIYVDGARTPISQGEDSFVAINDTLLDNKDFSSLFEVLSEVYEKIYIFGKTAKYSKEYHERLKKIKSLVDAKEGQVVYIPGMADFSVVAVWDDLCDPRADSDYIKLDDKDDKLLVNWLRKLPIQRVHVKDGISYCMANRFFNQRMMDEKPNCNFNNYMKDVFFKIRPEINDIIGYEQAPTVYDIDVCPNANSVILTANYPGELHNDEIVNSNGDKITVLKMDDNLICDGTCFLYKPCTEVEDESDYVLMNRVLELAFQNDSDLFDSRYGKLKISIIFDAIVNSCMLANDSEVTVGSVDTYLNTENAVLGDLPVDTDLMYLIDILGKDNIREVLSENNCESLTEYVNVNLCEKMSDAKVYNKTKPTE